MASRMISTCVHRSFCFSSGSTPFLSSSSSSSNPHPNLCFPTSVSHINIKSSFGFKLKHVIPTASSPQELPSELVEGEEEDSKFVPLNPDDPTYGPPALLLLGFELEEAVKIKQCLKELDGEFLEVVLCTEDMMNRSLWEAINTKQSTLEDVKIAKSLPRICFLSGLSGEDMMMFIDAFPESGLEPPVFAALVPNSADKPLQQVIEEIMGDHEMISSKKISLDAKAS